MTPPELAFDRFLREKHARHEDKYVHIAGRVAIDDLPPAHVYRWFVAWMNHQLSDIGVNSTGGVALPPLHFGLVAVNNGAAAAHVFEAEEFGFMVMTQPMFDEMVRLSHGLVEQNPAFGSRRIAPAASSLEVTQLLLLMQFSFVTSHEYSHLVRRHLEDEQPHAAALGQSLGQTQELDADGYAIYHELAYLFQGGGRQLASQWLRISDKKALENAILSCFLLAIMIQFCARWAGKKQVESDLRAEHPPAPVRIEFALLFIEMWCREVGALSTSWMTDGTLKDCFAAAARLFPQELKAAWDGQLPWLKSPGSEEYRAHIRRGIDRLRTGRG